MELCQPIKDDVGIFWTLGAYVFECSDYLWQAYFDKSDVAVMESMTCPVSEHSTSRHLGLGSRNDLVGAGYRRPEPF